MKINEILSEYPRPNFVRNSYFNLNGEWDISIQKNNALPTSFSKKVLVPYAIETEISGIKHCLRDDEYIIYHKQVELPKRFKKELLYLCFEGVDQIAYIYINNVEVGSHVGGYNRFSIEISDYVTNNNFDIYVVVLDKGKNNSLPRGKQEINNGGIWYRPTSGIFKTVWLEATYKAHIKEVYFTPLIEQKAVKILVKTTCNGNVKIQIGKENFVIKSNFEEIVKLNDFNLWSFSNPYLYDVNLVFKKDKVKTYFGLRKIESKNDKNGKRRVIINKEPVFINGLLYQGYYFKGDLTPLTYKEMENDIVLIKKMGFNTLRLHIKIENEYFYYLCDKLGILVIQDFVNGGYKYNNKITFYPGLFKDHYYRNDKNYKLFAREDEYGRKEFVKEMSKVQEQLFNHPSVIIYTIFNEGWGQFDANNNYEFFRNKDRTRLYDATSGWIEQGESDFKSIHNYFYPQKNYKTKDKIYIISEFGGYSYVDGKHFYGKKKFGYRHYNSISKLTNAYTKLYLKKIKPLIKNGLSGIIYTEFNDVEDEVNGLVTYDREIVKINIKKLNDINNELYDEFNKSIK
ncbi:MAG: glycoside hydrolase family 2 TIM barrel-domain containing protein [Bacilli bacterium]